MSIVEIKKTIHDKIERIGSEGDLHAVLDILNKLEEEKTLSTNNIDAIL